VSDKTRGPIVDGIFYPADAEKLTVMVRSLIDGCATQPASSSGIIVPHAALKYSGAIAASGFKSALGRNIAHVVIIGPIHRDPAEGIIFTESSFFNIPGATLEVDTEIIDELASCSSSFAIDDISHMEEHCIEVQLPFVQVLFPGAKIIPILVGRINGKITQSLVNALRLIFQENMDTTLFVVSANLGFAAVEEDAKEESEKLRRMILEGNATGISEIAEKGISSCGASSVAILLNLLGSGKNICLLSEGNNSSTDNNSHGIAQYAAFGIS